MLKVNDRVHFKDREMNETYGILIILDIKGEIATLTKGDYSNFGSHNCNAKLTEIEKSEE